MSDFFDRLGTELERAIASDTARQRRSFSNLAVAFSAAVFVLVVIGATLLLVRPFSGDTSFAPVTQLSEVPVDLAVPVSNAVNDVRGVAAAADGSLWAATGGGIVHWDVATETPTVYTTADGLPANHASRIAVAADGIVWAGDSGWVARFDGGWEIFAAPPGVDGPAMTIDAEGVLWGVGGENELYRFDGSEWGVTEVPELSGVGEWSASLAAAPDGTIWAATNMGKGLLSFDGERWTDHSGDLPDGFAMDVALTPSGNVWVGSESDARGDGPGVARLDEAGWSVFTTADGLAANHALVAVGTDGIVWATHPDDGTRGVSRFDGERWTAFTDVDTSGWGLAVDSSGTMWMASPQGLVGFDGETTIRLAVAVSEPPPTTTSAFPREGWNPILATTQAKTLPEVVSPGLLIRPAPSLATYATTPLHSTPSVGGLSTPMLSAPLGPSMCAQILGSN
jgi:ligand-binding sensor domain-containing protein